jgi:hypothetical protein
MAAIESIETRFKEVTGLTHLDLSIPHFQKGDNQQQKTTKSDFKNFGWVCTPLWLVDEMLEPQIPNLTLTSKTCDACSGCGQFSIRLMRKMYNKIREMGASEDKANAWIQKVWLSKLHYFTEFQFSNVAKLIYIFGPQINVYAGDSLNMKYAKDADKGLLFFNEKRKSWLNIPNLQPEVEKRKDDLDALVTLFKVLETNWNLINHMKN